MKTGEQETQAAACVERANYYRFLARLLYEELNDELIAELAEGLEVVKLPQDENDIERNLAIGMNKMAKYAQRATKDTKTESKCDYARVFLGAGQVKKMAVSPYESVYTSPDRLLMQDARDDVFNLYREEHIAISDGYNMPEDHIAFLFQFAAHLLTKQADALDAGDAVRAEAYEAKATSFVSKHLADWVTRFCDEAAPSAKTAFYQGLLQCVDAWVRLECRLYGLDIEAIVEETLESIEEARRMRMVA